MRICLYGAASPTIDPEYIEKVEILGKELARRGHSMVFGAGANGLMGAAARGVHSAGGHITGVIPRFFDDEDIEEIYTASDKLVETDTMRERKQAMEDLADAFLIVPGGIGTFEEFFEILTLKQLCRHNKPIAIYNLKGYYNPLVALMEHSMERNFIRGNCAELYTITEDMEELFRCLEADPNTELTVKDLKDG